MWQMKSTYSVHRQCSLSFLIQNVSETCQDRNNKRLIITTLRDFTEICRYEWCDNVVPCSGDVYGGFDDLSHGRPSDTKGHYGKLHE